MPKQPLAEVFGFPITNTSADASRYQKNRLCPYNNKVPNCTKDKAEDPLGVCTLFEGDEPTIVCPVRFREDWIITVDAAKFPESCKAAFDRMHAEDKMATDKLKEGIDGFSKAITDLEKQLETKLS